jgi:D-3-phosphoglycerate dehydrogenase
MSRSFGGFHEGPLQRLKQVAHVTRSDYGRPLKEHEMKGVVKDVDAIVVGDDPVTREVMKNANRLRVIAKHGVGLDKIDLSSATEKGIYVTFTPGAVSDSVADHTLALMLALARRIPQAHVSTKSGNWESRNFMGVELAGKTLGLFGFGRIGSKVAERALGFGMKIMVNEIDPDRVRQEIARVEATFVDKETLLRSSDIVVVLIPLSHVTEHFIGGKELALMKKTAFLINTARGPLVDQSALYEALKEGKIWGAALDVYDEEPPGRDFPIFDLDNVIVTPHIAGYTYEANYNMDAAVVEDIIRVFEGRLPEYLANPDVLGKAQ